jgi:predicted nucleotide-binding protein
MRKPTVFILNSFNSTEEHAAHQVALRLEPYATPFLWSDIGSKPGRIAESLAEAADQADFAVVLIADLASPNLMFEMGFPAGRIGSDRNFLVVVVS